MQFATGRAHPVVQNLPTHYAGYEKPVRAAELTEKEQAHVTHDPFPIQGICRAQVRVRSLYRSAAGSAIDLSVAGRFSKVLGGKDFALRRLADKIVTEMPHPE